MIDETKSFGANGFRKREMVVTTDEQYPQHIMIEFTQDKCDLLNNYKVGEPVKVSINLRGREWVNPQGETKYFNSIQGWRIEKMQPEAPQGQPQQGNRRRLRLTILSNRLQITGKKNTTTYRFNNKNPKYCFGFF